MCANLYCTPNEKLNFDMKYHIKRINFKKKTATRFCFYNPKTVAFSLQVMLKAHVMM